MDSSRITILVLASLSLLIAIAVIAAEGSVTATVTIENVAVSVTDGEVVYGTLGLNTSTDTVALGDSQTVSNDGNVDADFTTAGQDSATWTLAGTAGSDQYKHEFSSDSGSTWTALTTSYQDLALSVATSATVGLDLQITTPTATSSYEEQSVDVTVQATAS